jgi:hypothetical protein
MWASMTISFTQMGQFLSVTVWGDLHVDEQSLAGFRKFQVPFPKQTKINSDWYFIVLIHIDICTFLTWRGIYST